MPRTGIGRATSRCPTAGRARSASRDCGSITTQLQSGAAQSRQRHAGAPAAGLAEPGQRQHQPDQHLSPADRRRLLQFPALRRSLESRLRHRAANRYDRPGRAGRGRDSPEGFVRRAAQSLSRGTGHQHTGAMEVGCSRRRAVSDQHRAAGLQSGRRTLARRRCGHGDQPAEPARAVRRLGLLGRRAVQRLHRLPVGLLGSHQQSLGHHLLVRLHAAAGAGLALLFRRAASSSSMPHCATSRCSTTPATAARATSTATA